MLYEFFMALKILCTDKFEVLTAVLLRASLSCVTCVSVQMGARGGAIRHCAASWKVVGWNFS